MAEINERTKERNRAFFTKAASGFQSVFFVDPQGARGKSCTVPHPFTSE
jgi:hypothetical protein